MLKYREFLQQSRARRGITQFPVHYQIPSAYQIKSSENIKQFVSNPGYGQIFYSQDRNPNINPSANPNYVHKSKQHQMNYHLKSSLKSQQNRSQQIKGYIDHLQQQNFMLKSKLSQVQFQQGSINGNINSRNNVEGRANFGMRSQYQDGGYQGNPILNQNIQPEYITSQLPSQNYIKEQPVLHNNGGHPSFNQNINNQNIYNNQQPHYSQPQSSTFLPAPNTSGHMMQTTNPYLQGQQTNPKYKMPKYTTQPQTFTSQVQPVQAPQKSVTAPPQAQYNPDPRYGTNQSPRNNNIPYRQSFPIYASRPGLQSPQGSPEQRQSAQSLFTLAKQKLNQLKDDDEQLRAYTIKLLKK